MLRKLITLTLFVVLWQNLVSGLEKILKSLLKFCCPSLLRRWDSLSPFYRKFWRKFLHNVIVGLSVVWIITLLDEHSWFANTQDDGIDFIMQFYQDIIPEMEKKKIPAFIFLDVDDVSRQQWDDPLVTPREKIKNLIATAVQGQASLVVVDYDLNRPIPVAAGAPLHFGDQALKTYLANYASQHCQETENSCPPILLARTFQLPTDSIPKPRLGFLEEAVEQSAPYVQWGTVQFERSDYDQRVRRWRLWEPVCVENQPAMIPSIELLAAALIRNQDPLTAGNSALTPAETQALLNKRLTEFQPENCQHEEEPIELSSQIQMGDLTINTDQQGIFQRVRFSFSWPADKKPGLDYFQYDQSGQLALAVLSAHHYAKLPVESDISVFKNNIVIIGSSSPQTRDIYPTPLGEMPGAMIIVNAIHSLLEYGVIKPVPSGVKVVLMVILIFVMSWLFTRLNPFMSMILLIFLIGVVVLPIAIALFRYGVWLDFALPLLVVQIYQMTADLDELRKKHSQAQIEVGKKPLEKK